MNRILQVLLLLLAYQIVISVIFGVGDIVLERFQLMEWYYLLKPLTNILVLSVLIFLFVRKNYFSEIQSKPAPNVLILLVGLGVCLKAFRNPLYHINEIISGKYSTGIESLGSTSHYIVFVVSFVILTPLVEEFIFRGVVLQRLLTKYSGAFSILVSSLLFALFHLNIFSLSTSYNAALGAFILGLFSGIVYFRSRNIWYTVLLHSVGNLLTFLSNVLFQKEYAGIIRYFNFDITYWMVVAVSIMLTFIILRNIVRRFKKQTNYI